MAKKLHVLLVEDRPSDAELILRSLRKAGYELTSEIRVDTEEAFLRALALKPEIILSDYTLPEFSGLRALELLRQSGLNIPLIVISGTIGEDTAVQAMKFGAADYLLKDRLERLGIAVARALEESQLRLQAARSQADLEKSEETFRQLAENIREVFWMTDPQKRTFLYISPAYESIWGRTCSELQQNPSLWLAAIHPDDRTRVENAGKIFETTGKYSETYRIARPDGSRRWIHDRAFPVKNRAGQVYRIVGTAEDITERKLLEMQFLHAQRLEAVGTLSSGIAHDLNNILAPIMMVSSLLRDKLTEPADHELLGMVETGAQRGTNIIKQLLTFGRGVEGERGLVQSRHLLKELIGLMRETFPREIKVVDSLASDVPPVFGDATQLSQVFMNLCVNARDAMPRGGTLTLSSRLQVWTKEEIPAGFLAQPGTYVGFVVTDTGDGIPQEILDRIFEPFFTTKEVGKGTGLGLSTVLGITKSHSGFVSVKSHVGEGSSFTIWLPATEAKAVQDVSLNGKKRFSGGNQLVLVVDDEESIRSTMAHALRLNGFRVLTAAEGVEGLSVFLQNRQGIRLIITDEVMPAMGGIAFVRAVRRVEPRMPFIVMSGLLESEKSAELVELGIEDVLLKPFSPSALVEVLRRILTPAI